MKKVANAVGLTAVCAAPLVGAADSRMPRTTRLQPTPARVAPTDITAGLWTLSANDRQVLAQLVQASNIIDALCLRQAWAGNGAMLSDLARDDSPEGRARPHYFLINKGPWSRL